MNKNLLMAAAAACLFGLAPLAQAQFNPEANCRQEISNRGWSGHSFDQVRINGGQVTGLLRSGAEVLAFSCMVDNNGSVNEVRVDKAYGARNDTALVDNDYKRGYRDGSTKSPYNNYANSGSYDQGYEEGYQARRRR